MGAVSEAARTTAAITPSAIRDGDSVALRALTDRRGAAVLAYCERLCSGDEALAATAEAFGLFRAAVMASARPNGINPDRLLLAATRRAAARRAWPSAGLRDQALTSPASPCEHAPHLLAARAEGRLLPALEQRLARHLRACPACRQTEQRLAAAESAYLSAEPTAPTAAAAQAIHRSLINAAPPSPATAPAPPQPETGPAPTTPVAAVRDTPPAQPEAVEPAPTPEAAQPRAHSKESARPPATGQPKTGRPGTSATAGQRDRHASRRRRQVVAGRPTSAPRPPTSPAETDRSAGAVSGPTTSGEPAPRARGEHAPPPSRAKQRTKHQRRALTRARRGLLAPAALASVAILASGAGRASQATQTKPHHGQSPAGRLSTPTAAPSAATVALRSASMSGPAHRTPHPARRVNAKARAARSTSAASAQAPQTSAAPVLVAVNVPAAVRHKPSSPEPSVPYPVEQSAPAPSAGPAPTPPPARKPIAQAQPVIGAPGGPSGSHPQPVIDVSGVHPAPSAGGQPVINVGGPPAR
jgi:hypothetical protein